MREVGEKNEIDLLLSRLFFPTRGEIRMMKGPRGLGVLIALLGVAIFMVDAGGKARGEPLSWDRALEKKVPESRGLVKLGKRIYGEVCTQCHGEGGKGDGKGAWFITPQPRDFTSGMFKVRTTPSGSLPTDEDLFRTITVGFPDYRMPRFKYLTAKERWAVVYYIKTLSPLFKEGKPEKPINLGKAPPVTPKVLATGKELYREAGCADCHGKSGRGDGPSKLKDDWGNPTSALDFTRGERSFKGGAKAPDIVRTLLTGLTGTPMPSYAETLEAKQAWALGYYIEKLAGKGPGK